MIYEFTIERQGKEGSSIIIAAQKAMYIYIFKLNLYKEKGS